MAGVYDCCSHLVGAASNGHIECTRVLLQAGADVNKADYSGFTPLICAANNDNSEVLKLLLEAGASVNYTKPNDGYSALMCAAMHGNQECI